jgi:hypothetical protein
LKYVSANVQVNAPYTKKQYEDANGKPVYETIGYLEPIKIIDDYFMEINQPIP